MYILCYGLGTICHNYFKGSRVERNGRDDTQKRTPRGCSRPGTAGRKKFKVTGGPFSPCTYAIMLYHTYT